MHAFQGALDALFADPNLAKDATYRSRFFVRAVRVMVRQPDELLDFGATQLAHVSRVVELRVSEVEAPEFRSKSRMYRNRQQCPPQSSSRTRSFWRQTRSSGSLST